MKGDFTRDTFDSTKHYQQVLMQQGRAQLDADWNEKEAIDEHRDETTTADIVGLCGGPADGAAFGVVASLADLTKVPATVANWFNGLASTEKTRITHALAKGDFLLTPGRYYVEGTQCELESPVLFSEQPDRFGVEALTKGSYLLYLDVWQRHITAVEDPEIRESALGGPDTATRVKNIWQVGALSLDGTVDTINPCASGKLDTDLGTALLTARTESEPAPDDPCIVPSSGGYRGLENQLYRVEIHEAAKGAAAATWKWSRENGSVVTAIVEIKSDDKKVITVSSLGPDEPLGFAPNAWVEILDDALELEDKPGQLVQIDEVDESTRTITLKTEVTYLPASDRHPKLRRWEGRAAVGTDWLPLENGVQVKFADGDYRTGHYWLIPARTATAGSPSGEIEWPLDATSNPIALPPKGVAHHFCRLGIVTVSSGTIDFTDCRCLYSPLTHPQLLPIGGDGQEVMPDLTQPSNLVSLPQPISVYVRNLQCDEAAVKLRFKVTPATDKLTVSAKVSAQGILDVPAAVGVIECNWQLDPGSQPPERKVEVSLIDSNDESLALPPPLFFTANLSIASQVAYDPAKCANLADARTVQDAIDILCKLDHGGSCCCVTVGEGGDFGSLEEALTNLIDKQKIFDICLCLLPGDHAVTQELVILPVTQAQLQQSTYVRIAGCGRNTRLFLKAALSAHGLASFSLIDLTVVSFETNARIINSLINTEANPLVTPIIGPVVTRANAVTIEAVSNPIIIGDCAEVTIKGCYLKQDSKTATDFLTIGNASRILIENNVIEPATVNKTTATALVIADANARTEILNNMILGQVRFYGSASGAAAQKTFDSNIASPIAAGDLLIERNATGHDAQIVGNSFQGLVVDGEIVPTTKRDQKGTTISGLFRRVSLLNNVIDASVNEWLGEHVISNGNHFIVPKDSMTVGTACGSSFICVGTSANYPDTTLRYSIPAKTNYYRESANLISLSPLP